MQLVPLWTHTLGDRPVGISLAREARLLLAWDGVQQPTLFDFRGRTRGSIRLPLPAVAAALCETGQHVVAAAHKHVWWFNQELRLQFDIGLPAAVIAVALEPHGNYLAASDEARGLHLFNRLGQPIASWEAPRPIHHLVFVPGQARLLAAADFGFLGAFDSTGRCLWRDTPLTHVGSLTCSGAGDGIALACFTEGLRRYDGNGGPLSRWSLPVPCRRAAMDYAGQAVLAAGDDASLYLLNPQGRVSEKLVLEHSVSALALGALGDLGFVGLARGEVLAIGVQQRD